MTKTGILTRFARNCARCARAIMLSVRQYRRFYQTDLRSEFYRSATIRSTTFSSHYFRTEATPPCSSLSEPASKREPPRFARRLKKLKILKMFKSFKHFYFLLPSTLSGGS